MLSPTYRELKTLVPSDYTQANQELRYKCDGGCSCANLGDRSVWDRLQYARYEQNVPYSMLPVVNSIGGWKS